MRIPVPPLSYRRAIDSNLAIYFRSHRPTPFRRAISDLCRYYNVKQPRIEWYEYLDWGKTAGKTYEDGRIHLIHPENWKRGRIYKSERMWIQTLYHEMGHYLFWADAERKADAFQRKMVLGLRAHAARSRGATRGAVASRRRPAERARKRHWRMGGALRRRNGATRRRRRRA